MKIRVIAVNPKYRTLPFYMTGVYDEEIKNYRTGQENLSKAELAELQLVIDPIKQYPIRHHQELNTDIQKDRALYELAMVQPDIANNSRSVIGSKHVMYLENLEKEAETKIIKRDLFFDAMMMVKKNSSDEQTKNLGIFLGINVSQPISVVLSAIYSFCENEPLKIRDFFSGKHINRLFVLKLKHYGILMMRNGSLYDGEILVGRTVLEAVGFVQDHVNDQLISKWGLALDTKEGRTMPQKMGYERNPRSGHKKAETKTTETKKPETKKRTLGGV